MAEPGYIIVVGASAGGLNSVIELAAGLTEEMNAAILVVLHTPNSSYSDVVIDRIQRNTVFTCVLAEDHLAIQAKHLYLAIPDQHLMVTHGRIKLGRGAAENRWRPSIDVLFRSAAVAYNSRAIGIILTGLLEDGTAGMQNIKKCGGTCIVQDPEEAEYPDMPKSVLRYVDVDYCTTLHRISIIIKEKTTNGIPEAAAVPATVAKEAAIAERAAIGIENVEPLGERSPYSCPDCGGALWEIKEKGLTRYRCHTGHMFTADELQEGKRIELENSFWVALRIMEERRNLLNKMADEEQGKGWQRSAASKIKRAKELEEHINRIKELLFDATDDHDPSRLELEGE